MTLYRRLRKSDCWHFHELCQHWKRMQRYDEDRVIERPGKQKSGEACNECSAKTRREKQAKA